MYMKFKLIMVVITVNLVTGCAAIPVAVSAINGANKKGDQSSTLTCKAFPEDAFRTASASNNGMVTTTELGRSLASVHSSNNVKVILQTVKLSQDAKPAVIEKSTSLVKKKGSKQSEQVITEKVISPATEAVFGTYQIYGSSSNGVSRAWEFDDGIGDTTQRVVDALVTSGCTLVETKREASMVDSLVSKSNSQ
jgi:hypothetical protein